MEVGLHEGELCYDDLAVAISCQDACVLPLKSFQNACDKRQEVEASG